MMLMGIRGIAAPFLGAALLQWHVISMHGMFAVSAVGIFAGVLIQIVGYRKYPVARNGEYQKGDCAT